MDIALLGYYGKGNFGDNLMQDKLSEILSNNGEHKVTVYSKEDTTPNCYLHEDIIVIGGGSIISPDFFAFRKHRLSKLVEEKGDKQLIFLNVNITSDILQYPEFISNLKRLKAKWWVRDTDSVEILSSIGIKSTYLPDIIFSLDIQKTNSNSKKLTIFTNAFLFETLVSENVGEFLTAIQAIRTLSEYLNWMIHFGWSIILCPCQNSKYMDDRISSGMIYNLIKNKDYATWITDSLEYKEILDIITSSDLIISTRYHSSCAAIRAGIPLIDISHHNKNRCMLSDLDCKESSLEYEKLTIKNLQEITQLVESKEVTQFEAKNSWFQFKEEFINIVREKENGRV